jgi:hypothetical protein
VGQQQRQQEVSAADVLEPGACENGCRRITLHGHMHSACLQCPHVQWWERERERERESTAASLCLPAVAPGHLFSSYLSRQQLLLLVSLLVSLRERGCAYSMVP